MACFPRRTKALDQLRRPALARLARGEPVDPDHLDTWAGRDQHAHAILHRHGNSGVAPTRLTLRAIRPAIDAPAAADRAASLNGHRTAPAAPLRAPAHLGPLCTHCDAGFMFRTGMCMACSTCDHTNRLRLALTGSAPPDA